jgi:hypothetical protein
VAVPVEPCQTAASGPGPERAVRAERQRKDPIVRQAAIGVGRGVGLPVAVLVEPRQSALGSSPDDAVRAEC